MFQMVTLPYFAACLTSEAKLRFCKPPAKLKKKKTDLWNCHGIACLVINYKRRQRDWLHRWKSISMSSFFTSSLFIHNCSSHLIPIRRIKYLTKRTNSSVSYTTSRNGYFHPSKPRLPPKSHINDHIRAGRGRWWFLKILWRHNEGILWRTAEILKEWC